jgi:hypothetical protein
MSNLLHTTRNFSTGSLRLPVALAMVLAPSPTPAGACEDEHPPVVRQPVVRRTLCDASGQAVVEMQFDPRGLSQVHTADEPAAAWMRDEEDVWHYREWQWWRGHPWGDSCRPRYWTTARFAPSDRQLTIDYLIDGFDCRQTFLLPASVEATRPHWDLVVSIRNVSGQDVQEYGQFFACYTALNSPNSCWFWERGDRLTKFAEHGVEHLDGYVSHPDAYFRSTGAVPHCPRGGGKIVSTWHRPVLVSHPSAEGWRSVILIEARYASALAQGIRGKAMDYIVFPGPDARTFPDESAFAVHVRHHLLKSSELPTLQTLAALWDNFEQAHDKIHRLAAGRQDP